MPISIVIPPTIVNAAARAEGLDGKQVAEILAATPAEWFGALTNYVTELKESATLEEIRKAFPRILKTGSAEADSFLVRVAVAATGGVSA